VPTSRSIRPEAWLTALGAALCTQAAQAATPAPLPAEWHAAAQPTLPGAATGMAEMLLDVQINRQPLTDGALILADRNGTLYVSQADLLRWRLRAPAGEPALRHLGQAYHAVAALDGVTATFDPAAQRLLIEAPASAFFATALSEAAPLLPVPVRSDNGGFINYDLYAQRAADRTDASAAAEVGVFTGVGVGTASFLASRIGGVESVTRLETTWTLDLPERRTSLRVGDATTLPASGWGRSTRFGGIQYGTNAATQPYLLTMPLQRVSGEAALPSQVDIFVNQSLISSQSVPPGPFSVNGLPGVTGLGEMRVVVRDVFGREQVMTQPFYASMALLQTGLSEFSIESGQVRTNYAQPGEQYGRQFGSGTYRVGLNDRFTGEVHGEAADGGQVTAGLSGVQLLPTVGLFSAAAALSHRGAGNGQLLGLGFERNNINALSIGLRGLWASREFTQIGQEPGELPPQQLLGANANVFAAGFGSFGVGYARQDYYDRPRAEFVSANYGSNLGRRVYLNLSLQKALAGDRAQSLYASVTMPLGERSSASVTAQRNTSSAGQPNQELVAQAQQGLPPGSGLGWQVQASSLNRQDAGVAWQNDHLTTAAAVTNLQGQTTGRVAASGSLAFVGGSAFAGRRISDSFGVVQLPDYPGVRVYADNQLITRTDAQGNAFLPRLRAYEKNGISVDAGDFPLDAQIDTLRIDAVPYSRSGLVLQFPVRRSAGALVRLVLDDGSAVPAGAVVRLAGSDATFPVAMDGEAWVTGLAESNVLQVTWRDRTCAIMLTMPKTSDPLPQLGPFVCHGVTR
jgi:outer membrane usher protein